MAIEFQCDCGERLQTQDKNAGRAFKCPKCGMRLTVPKAVSDEADCDVIEEAVLEQIVQPDSSPTIPVPTGTRRIQPASPYPACATMRVIFILSGVLCFAAAVALTVLLVARGSAPGFQWTPDFVIAACVAPFFVVVGFSQFAMAELLGGIVAFLVKRECLPD